MTAEQFATQDIEFWPISTVTQKVGLSRSEIYRRMEGGRFPKSRAYRDSTRKFWLSNEVRSWQADEVAPVELGDDEAALIG